MERSYIYLYLGNPQCIQLCALIYMSVYIDQLALASPRELMVTEYRINSSTKGIN